MTSLVLDAGAFVAVERNDRPMLARLRIAQRAELGLKTTGIVVAEVWRDPRGRQANLARLLKSVGVEPVDEPLGRGAGVLLGRAGVGDAADATVVAAAAAGDLIVTSDPDHLRALVDAADRNIAVIGC